MDIFVHVHVFISYNIVLGIMLCGSHYIVCTCTQNSLSLYSEQSKRTAARESYEETLGVLGTTDDLLTLLENNKENNVFEVSE